MSWSRLRQRVVGRILVAGTVIEDYLAELVDLFVTVVLGVGLTQGLLTSPVRLDDVRRRRMLAAITSKVSMILVFTSP